MDRIYLDHAATTPLAPEVLDAMLPHLREQYGNASSVHQMGRQARFAVEESRERVAHCLGAEPGEIVFTSGGTESDNFAIKGALASRSTDGRTHLVTSAAEHEAVLRPAERLEADGYDVTILTPEERGAVRPQHVEEAITAETALVSLMHANNEIGTLTSIREIADICHEQDVWLHCDAVQTAGLLGVDVQDLGIDLMSVSGHKFYGPKGTGCLYVRGGIDLGPLVEGGSQERDRRGGTENVPGVVGFAEALEHAVNASEERVDRIATLRDRLVDGIREKVDPPFVFNTPVDQPDAIAPHIVNVSFPPVDDRPLDGEMLILNLDMQGLMVSAGSACTSGAMEPSHVLSAIGRDRATASAAVRFSLGRSNTEDEIDAAVDALASTVTRMRR
ncbi:cysteine desulfurase NifS [Longibacter salinarum]|uniref:cysteine desulfurase n=1 Tax=Longibacter salinarum TaxID=1850348 RepID=A0A2A8D2B4_9BACT|nr:cysteine desulfurase family protein [Longibacter salinarum]PEN15024.1 cysteine desulfurase NifS [Longibacter salinarum]